VRNVETKIATAAGLANTAAILRCESQSDAAM
jgi:hypothetical protein